MDWNGDGLVDILVGEHNGRIKYYMAVTADSLTEMDDLKAAGEYIDGGLVGCPLVFDWNNDSLNDLLVGFASPTAGSSIQLYINSGTPSDPVLEAGVDVLFGGEPLAAYGCTPCLADLNQDGLQDIIFGNSPGAVNYCENTGTLSSPVFSQPVPLETETEPISLNLNSAPYVVDWNDDGHLDIVSGCGETGHIYAFLSPYTSGVEGSGEGSALHASLISNPVSSTLSIAVSSNAAEVLNVSVYSLCGRLVADLGSQNLSSGTNSIQFSLEDMNPGIYLAKLSTSQGNHSLLFTVLKGI